MDGSNRLPSFTPSMGPGESPKESTKIGGAPSPGPGESPPIAQSSVARSILSTVGEFAKQVEQRLGLKSLFGTAQVLKSGLNSAGITLGSNVSALASKVSHFVESTFNQATSTTDFKKLQEGALKHIQNKLNESLEKNDQTEIRNLMVLKGLLETSESVSDIKSALKGEKYTLPNEVTAEAKTTISDRLDKAKTDLNSNLANLKDTFQGLKAEGERTLNRVLHAEANRKAEAMRDEVLSAIRNRAPSAELKIAEQVILNAVKSDGSVDTALIKQELKLLNQQLEDDQKIGQRFLTDELVTNWEAASGLRDRSHRVSGEKIDRLMLAKEELLKSTDQNYAFESRAAADNVSFFDDKGKPLSVEAYKQAVLNQLQMVAERADELEMKAYEKIADFKASYTKSELDQADMKKILAELDRAHTDEGSFVTEDQLEANLKEIMNRAPRPKDPAWAEKAEKRAENRLENIRNNFIDQNPELSYLFKPLEKRNDDGSLKSENQFKEELNTLLRVGQQ